MDRRHMHAQGLVAVELARLITLGSRLPQLNALIPHLPASAQTSDQAKTTAVD